MADLTYDLCVYGATESAIFAAIAAKRGGLARVCLVIDAQTIDNFSTCGLGRADIGKSRLARGLYRTFAKLTGNLYGRPLSYPFGSTEIERLFWRWLGDWGVDVIRGEQVATVQMTGTAITQLTMESGLTVSATGYIDGSLMGDVMMRALPRVAIADATAAGPKGWTLGSESLAAFGESMAGFKTLGPLQGSVNTRYENGDLRNGVTPDPQLTVGSAWDGVMAPGVRTMVTDDPAILFPWKRITEEMTNPYDKEQVLFAASYIGRTRTFAPNGVSFGKYDLNSIVMVTDPTTKRPLQWDYPLMTYAQRTAARTRLLDHFRSLMFYTATDPDHSGNYQTTQKPFGTPRDEYFATTRFTTRLPYWREGPRLRGEYILTQDDLHVTDTNAPRHSLKSDSICCGGYSMDIKASSYLTVSGSTTTVLREGDNGSISSTTGARAIAPNGYQVPFRAMLPAAAQCTNLLVTYCASCTHIAWGSMRIIVTNAMMGEAAGVAWALAILAANAIHSYATTNYQTLRDTLIALGARLDPATSGDDGDEDDTDGDGIPDDIDTDDDDDGLPDDQDEDDDGDGIPDTEEEGGG